MYGGLAFFLRLWVAPIRMCTSFNVTLRYFMPVLIAGLYGTGMELVQGQSEERSAEFLDILADIAGAILAVAFVGVWLQVRNKRAAVQV